MADAEADAAAAGGAQPPPQAPPPPLPPPASVAELHGLMQKMGECVSVVSRLLRLF